MASDSYCTQPGGAARAAQRSAARRAPVDGVAEDDGLVDGQLGKQRVQAVHLLALLHKGVVLRARGVGAEGGKEQGEQACLGTAGALYCQGENSKS